MMWSLPGKALRLLPPETAHRATIKGLAAGLGPRFAPDRYPSLRTSVAGLELDNPVGLAAGFDKNAEVPDEALRMGFGFVEVGAVTPRPQTGNPRPRMFRLPKARAVINRAGFNNDGLEAIQRRLIDRQSRPGIVGINLGANKDAEDRTADYVTGIQALAPHVSFCTVNISSPNTPGLRALQSAQALQDLLERVHQARVDDTPIFLKVAPDLVDEDKADIVAALMARPLDGVIISNTTIARPGGLGRHEGEQGGLSGEPLFVASTAVLREFARALDGQMPLIGVGGISGPAEAYAKITAGASLVQLYTALVYQGPGLIPAILKGLDDRLCADGFATIQDAVGAAL